MASAGAVESSGVSRALDRRDGLAYGLASPASGAAAHRVSHPPGPNRSRWACSAPRRRSPSCLLRLVARVWVIDRGAAHIMLVADIGKAALLATIPVAAAPSILRVEHLLPIACTVGVLDVFCGLACASFLPPLRIERNSPRETRSWPSSDNTSAARRLEMSFQSQGVTPAGTLHLPGSSPPHPAVVMRQGSGPADRDSGGYFPPIRDAFPSRGIAV